MNVKTQVFVSRYESRSPLGNHKRRWGWDFTAYAEPDVGKMRTEYQMGFATKAEAQAAGQAWADAQVADLQTMTEQPYKIVRFYQDDRPKEVIVRGLTQAQAQAHCQRDDTHGDGWFDGYEEEKGSESTASEQRRLAKAALDMLNALDHTEEES